MNYVPTKDVSYTGLTLLNEALGIKVIPLKSGIQEPHYAQDDVFFVRR